MLEITPVYAQVIERDALLLEADHLHSEFIVDYQKARYEVALSKAKRVLTIREEVLGRLPKRLHPHHDGGDGDHC